MPAAAPSAPRTISRAELLGLARAGQHWQFVPLAAQALRIVPHDGAIRLLLAACFAKLGLAGPAREQIELLDPASDPAVPALGPAIAALPPDLIPHDRLARTCEANLRVLAARGTDLTTHFEPWLASLRGWEWRRTVDGNIPRRFSAEERMDGRWLNWGDHAGAARRFIATNIAPAPHAHAVYTLEGLDPPWLFDLLFRATCPNPLGFAPRIDILQADPLELLDALAQADLAEALAAQRVEVFAGTDAALRLGRRLREEPGRAECQISGPLIPLLSTRTRIQRLGAALEHAKDDQVEAHRRLCARVDAIYARRDRAWWSRRYAEALGPDAEREPLRVLIVTSRYSTFIQHSSRDLQAAFRAAGAEAHLLVEPDSNSKLASIAYLRRIADLQPDLLVVINYFRANLGDWLPPRLPYLCWVQDAMPQQFDAAIGASQGELDFMAGHLPREFFEHFGFPRARALASPVVACGRKFHGARVQGAGRFACEIAFLSHHSETPDHMHERLVREAGDPRSTRLLNTLLPVVSRIAADPMGHSPLARLEQATRRALCQEIGDHPSEQDVARILRQYALPLADRIFRHETLAWAARIAARRAWRLHIYGRGWHDHPLFSAHARGDVAHDEELRAAYQTAAVHLHVSITTLVHQRVMECALSGGLPLCRLHTDAMALVRGHANRAAALSREPDACDLEHRWLGYAIADTPELMALAALMQRLGLPVPGPFSWAGRPARIESFRTGPGLGPESRPDWLLADMAEMTFRSEEGLERLVERAVEDPARRGAYSGAIAGRVRARLTHDAFVARVLEFIRERLGEAGAA